MTESLEANGARIHRPRPSLGDQLSTFVDSDVDLSEGLACELEELLATPTADRFSSPKFVLAVADQGGGAAIPLIDWCHSSRALGSPDYHMLKRAIDVVGASIGLVLLSPVMLIAMFLVWLEDGGPVMFRQKRVGINGDSFTIFKIRTMVNNAEQRLAEVAALNHHSDARTFKAKEDPRLLRVGKWLRRYSIDEFPQVLNVLRGDMSLVGPRPPLPREVDLYDAEDYIRLIVRPGLTCYWQVEGRGEVAFKDQVELDRRYVQDCSIRLDLLLIAKTPMAMLRGKGAH